MNLRGYKAKDLLKLKDYWCKLFQQKETYFIKLMFNEWLDDLMEEQKFIRGKDAVLDEVVKFMESITFDITNELEARKQYYSKPREMAFDDWKDSKQRRRERAVAVASEVYDTSNIEEINSIFKQCGLDDLLEDDNTGNRKSVDFSSYYKFSNKSLEKVFKEDYVLNKSN
jgi:hypothetical protein